jgi:hypothetical protein
MPGVPVPIRRGSSSWFEGGREGLRHDQAERSAELLQDGGGLGGGDFAAHVDVLGDGWLGVSELVGDGAGGLRSPAFSGQ